MESYSVTIEVEFLSKSASYNNEVSEFDNKVLKSDNKVKFLQMVK